MTEAVADDAVYREAARTYRSVGWSLLFVPVAFGADWSLSGRHGALVHLPGWVVFGGVLVGIHVLLLHAVRSTHSLSVTPDQVVVGDEALPRAEVVGVTPGRRAEPDLPTLGWPNGFPRKSLAVTLRLADGRDVLVPTRFPAELQRALHVGPPEPQRPADVRVADDAELAELPGIAERAAAVFRVAGYRLPDLPLDAAALRAAAVVLVVDTPAVGFAWVDEVDGRAHLRALAVLPNAMRRGAGSRLLEAACTWAADHGYRAVTLTTYADVPWNAPFFAARGFTPEPEPGPGLRAVVERERRAGLEAVAARVVLRRPLPPA